MASTEEADEENEQKPVQRIQRLIEELPDERLDLGQEGNHQRFCVALRSEGYDDLATRIAEEHEKEKHFDDNWLSTIDEIWLTVNRDTYSIRYDEGWKILQREE